MDTLKREIEKKLAAPLRVLAAISVLAGAIALLGEPLILETQHVAGLILLSVGAVSLALAFD